ncbi:MAG: ubiquinone biosynthesis accessory factor UbiJ [Enterovibrio sp.]
MFEPLDPLVAQLIKKGVNTLLLDASEESLRRLARLQGKVLRLYFSDLKKPLFFVFAQDIDVVAQFAGEVDCQLSLPVTLLAKLQDKALLAGLLKEGKLDLSGDIDVLLQFCALLEEVGFDLEEWISRYIGDVAAHSLVQSGKSLFSVMQKQLKRQQHYVSQLVIEEWRLSPNALEVAYFADCVTRLHDDVDALQERLDKFEQKIAAHRGLDDAN